MFRGKQNQEPKTDLSDLFGPLDPEVHRFIHKSALGYLEVTLLDEEQVNIVIPGAADSAIFVTPYRALVFKHGGISGVGFGSKFITWDIDAIQGVYWEFGRVSGVVAILTAGASAGGWETSDVDSTGAHELPHAISINERTKDLAEDGVGDLRELLVRRKHPA